MNKNPLITVYNIKGLFQVILPLLVLCYFITDGINLTYLVGSLIIGMLGWIVGSAVVHRIFSHRVIDIKSPIAQFVLGYISSVTIITPPISWAGNHHLHHKFSDTQLDPHSPVQIGFWKSLLFFNHQDFSDIVSKLSIRDTKQLLVSIKHLTKSKPLMFLEKHFTKVLAFHMLIMASLGVEYFIYLFCIPVFVSHLAEVFVVANHGGFLGGSPSDKNHKAYNRFWLWPLAGLEYNHADHHDNPRNDDLFNTIIRKVSI